MCRLLAELTDTNINMMRETIKRLESRSGEPAIDIRLTSEVHAQIHMKIRSLGLDPNDTNAKELYVALQNMAAVHDKFIRNKFSLGNSGDSDSFANDVDYIFSRLRFNRRSWGLRGASIRRLLRDNQPKNVAKKLGYRSIDSLIRRENPDLVLFLASRVEPSTWQTKLDKQLTSLTSVDFEEKNIDVLALTDSKYKKISEEFSTKYHTLVFGQQLTGSVFVMNPTVAVRPGMTLLGVMMSIKEASTMQYLHTQLKHHQLQGDFSAQVYDVFRHRNQKTASLAGHIFNWDIIHRHYGGSEAGEHSLMLEPHLQTEDLAYRRAEEILYRTEPALHFWHKTDYVGLKVGSTKLSFNLLDVLINLVNGLDVNSQVSGHLKTSVWDELLLRYMKNKSISNAVTAKFESQNNRINDVLTMEFA